MKEIRSLLKNQFSRSALETSASDVILYKEYGAKLLDFTLDQAYSRQKEIIMELRSKTDEELRKIIFEHDFPGHVWTE